MEMGTAWKAVGAANIRIQFDSVVFRHTTSTSVDIKLITVYGYHINHYLSSTYVYHLQQNYWYQTSDQPRL